MNNILVTGINGFVGKHLARELHSRGVKVIGIGNREVKANSEISDLLENYFKCDVTEPSQVSKLDLRDVDCIINLAGLANVGASFDNPELYMHVNVAVLLVLGEELLRQNPPARMIAVSTGAVYDPHQDMPLNESSKIIESGSPYSMSKLAMEDSAQILRDKGLDCIVVRPFNHIGPGQGLGFLIPDLLNKLRSLDKTNPKITAGNIKTIRDYSDVRDIVKAYADLAKAKDLKHNLYNICSGRGLSGEEIIKALCDALDIDFDKLNIEVDRTLIRPTDPLKIIGDNGRLRENTGWAPLISIDNTIVGIISAQ